MNYILAPLQGQFVNLLAGSLKKTILFVNTIVMHQSIPAVPIP